MTWKRRCLSFQRLLMEILIDPLYKMSLFCFALIEERNDVEVMLLHVLHCMCFQHDTKECIGKLAVQLSWIYAPSHYGIDSDTKRASLFLNSKMTVHDTGNQSGLLACIEVRRGLQP